MFLTIRTADIMADTILIAAPLKTIWKTRLPPSQKIRISAAFSASIGTTTTSLAHAYYLFHSQQNKEATAAILEVFTILSPRLYWTSTNPFFSNSKISVSLIVANLNVLVALVARIAAEPDRSPPTQWTSGWTPPSFLHFRSYRSTMAPNVGGVAADDTARRAAWLPFSRRPPTPTPHRISLSPLDVESFDMMQPKDTSSVRPNEAEAAMSTFKLSRDPNIGDRETS